MISPTHGFVQIPYRSLGAAVIIGHFSDFTDIHLMTELNPQSTVEPIQSITYLSRSYNVTIKHYHADYVLFDKRAFRASVSTAHQTCHFVASMLTNRTVKQRTE